MNIPFDEKEYYEFLESMIKHCKCCPYCSNIPCDGILAGGMCDEICNCDDDIEPLF